MEAVLAERYRSNTATGAAHDTKVTGSLHPIASDVVKVFLHYMQFLVLLLSSRCFQREGCLRGNTHMV